VLGHGKRLFADVTGSPVLELAHSTALDSGTMILTYRRS
jgi:hypothetical protein